MTSLEPVTRQNTNAEQPSSKGAGKDEERVENKRERRVRTGASSSLFNSVLPSLLCSLAALRSSRVARFARERSDPGRRAQRSEERERRALFSSRMRRRPAAAQQRFDLFPGFFLLG